MMIHIKSAQKALYLSALLLSGVFNAGCQATGQKQTTSPKTLHASDYYTKGVEAYAKWQANPENPQNLILANQMYSKAHALNPLVVSNQLELYRTAFTLAATQEEGNTKEELASTYAELHPLVQQAMTPPALIHYQQSQDNEEPADIRFTQITEAFSQNPYNAYVLSHLADWYLEQEQHDMATSISKLALELNPDSPYVLHDIGLALSSKAESSACVYEEVETIKRSVHYFNRAHALNKEYWLYVSNASLQYEVLGLLPLAYSQAKEAFDIEFNLITAVRLLEIAMLQNKYDDAKVVLAEIQQRTQLNLLELKYEKLMSYLAALKFLEQDFDTGYKYIYQANRFANHHFYQLHSRWLYKSTEQEFQSSLAKAEYLTDIEKLQASYLTEGADLDTETFIQKASNRCELSDFYFSAADKAKQNGDSAKAKQYLEKVLEQKTTRQTSYFWAKYLLANEALFL